MKIVVQILIVLLGMLPVMGQEHIKFSHITIDNGLPDNYSECILEDSEGFIWIGTNDGLCRYDGSEIRIFRNDPEDSSSIGSNYIFELFEDSDSNLWIGTNMGGLSRYDRRKNRFINYYFTAEDSYWHQRNRINEVIEHAGYLWLASMYGLGQFNPRTGSSKWFIPNEQREGIRAEQVMGLLPDERNNLLVGTLHGGLFYFNTDSLKFTKQYFNTNDPYCISDDNIKSLYRAKDGKVYIATEEGGINIFNEDTRQFQNLRFSESDECSLSSDDVVRFYEDSRNRFWVGTINGGVNIFDPLTNKFTRFLPHSNNKEGINAASVLDIIEDSFGNIWFSTHSGGVNCINHQQNRIKHFNTSNLPALINNTVSAFCEADNGSVYLGTDGGGLYKFDVNTFSLKAIQESGLESQSILDIINADNDHLWVATWGGGVSLYNCTSERVVKTYRKGKSSSSLSIDDVKALYLDKDTLWIAGHGGGVNILHIPSGNVTHYLNNQDLDFDMMRVEWGNDIVKDRSGNIWFASTVGLHRYSTGELKTYLHDQSDQNTLSGFIISALLVDTQGNLWVGTDSGLDRYNADDDNFIRNDALKGKIKSVSEGLNGSLWVSTNNGLFSYEPLTKRLQRFGEYDGLQGKQFFERASILLNDGSLLFGGMNGFNLFNPDSIKTTSFTISTYFTKFLISDIIQRPGAEGSILDVEINYMSEICLQHFQRVFAFEFSGINPAVSQRNEYYYMLQGFDSDWRKAGVSRRASYTNLDPGTYVFKVKTCIEDGNCDSPVKEITIIIKAPWWKTIWFRALLVVSIVFWVVLMYLIRVRRVQKQNIFLEQKVAERTKQLQTALNDVKNKGEEIQTQNESLKSAQEELVEKNEELLVLNNTKNKFLNIIAHDIKSPLNSILGFSELAKARFDELEKPKLLQFITLINSSSNHLYELVERLLQWARSQIDQIKVSPVSFSVEELITSNRQLAKSTYERKKIMFEVEMPEVFNVYADYTMADTVLRNIISNAIKFTPEDGKVSIRVSKTDKFGCISVVDTGIGMDDKLINNLFNPGVTSTRKGTNNEDGTGLGLLICQEFVIKNGGEIKVESKIYKGTTISFTLPLIRPKDTKKAVD